MTARLADLLRRRDAARPVLNKPTPAVSTTETLRDGRTIVTFLNNGRRRIGIHSEGWSAIGNFIRRRA